MTTIPLDDLIEALAGAIIDAQDQIEQHQLSNLLNYFDNQQRPKSLLIRLPSMNPNAGQDSEDMYRAPLLPLVSPNQLKIKDVELTFDVDLGGLPESSDEVGNDSGEGGGIKKNIMVDLAGAKSKEKRGNIHVVLRVEGADPTDGASRLINHLAQTQGVVNTVQVD
ncbi:MAG: DUF2589 domain-containing protein [Chlorobiaceae bacterium]|jgi:hypothetical protein|nr:DUF2589 domain-containing protein [Chlorobiaceae bacterium]